MGDLPLPNKWTGPACVCVCVCVRRSAVGCRGARLAGCDAVGGSLYSTLPFWLSELAPASLGAEEKGKSACLRPNVSKHASPESFCVRVRGFLSGLSVVRAELSPVSYTHLTLPTILLV